MTNAYNAGQWTAARMHSFIKGGLRGVSQRWPPRFAVKKDAWIERGVYKCAGYKKRWHKVGPTFINDRRVRKNNLFIDHIEPVISPKTGFVSWDSFISRLFCEAEGLQLLCSACHSLKTQDERLERQEYNV